MIIGFIAIGLATAGCSGIGNIFSGGGPERAFDDRVGPDTRELLRDRPEGLLPDTTNVRHGPSSLLPQ
ncbi:MAG: hypothetical protein WEB93_05785 [Sphingomonadales bacterium]